jgi:hypothetical protein
VGTRSLAVLAVATAVAAGCAGGDAGGRPAAAAPGGALVVRDVFANALTRVDVTTGRLVTVRVPQQSPGDPPYGLALAGGRLVVYGRTATFVLAPTLARPARRLGASWYFVPAAEPGRVWLALLDPHAPETRRDLRAVREVTATGRVVVPAGPRPPSPNLVAATSLGPVFQTRDALEVWDARSGRVVRRLPGPFPVAAWRTRLAWCREACTTIRVTDVASGRTVVLRPPAGTGFTAAYAGRFAPGGRFLAAPLAGGRVAVGDLRTRAVRVVPRLRLAAPYAALTWSTDGRWLFATAAHGRLAAFDPRAHRLVRLPGRLPGPAADMVAVG